MHELQLLQDLAVIMVVAGLVTIVFHRLKQPVVLGYLLAGFIVGPHTPPYPRVQDAHTIRTLSELGVILLMFSLGQHFSLRKLAAVGATAVIGATLEIGSMLGLGYLVGRAFGWSTMDCVFLGAILSISSTTIIVKALGELGKLKEHFAQLIFGILIVEDILAIALIALLSSLAASGALEFHLVAATLGKLLAFITMLLVVGLLCVPRLLRYVAGFKSNEMLLIVVLGLCFGVSLLAAKLGYSVALGAFLTGAIIAEARENGRIEQLVEPVRDMFSAVFFVAIGMLIDPHMLVEHWLPILVITVVVVLGKIAACTLGSFLAGNDARTSLRVGMGVSQIGEFSFIIAQLGLTLEVTSKFLYPIAVAVSAITTLLTPYLIKSSDGVVLRLARISPAPFTALLELYRDWRRQLVGAREQRDDGVRRMVRKLMLQVALDLVLVTGLLIAAGTLAHRPQAWLARLPEWTGGHGTLFWAIAMLLSLPLLIHAFLKVRVFSSILAELSYPMTRTDAQSATARALVANMTLSAILAAACVWIFAIGISTVPPWPVLLALLAVLGTMVALMWRRFVRYYAAAQTSLRETLSAAKSPQHEALPLTIELQGALLETIEISPSSPAANRLIRESALRTRTGASIVGIDRGGTSIVNPGADEELKVGDKLLVLGTQAQLDATRKQFAGAP